MEFNDIVTYPMGRDDWLKTILIGGVLTFLSILVVPIFLVYGYILRTIRGCLVGETEPPVFDEWGELLVDGLQAAIIGIIYMIVPILVGAIMVGSAMIAVITGDLAALGGVFLGFMLSMVLSLVFGYFAVVAIVNFAREGRFGAAFEFDVIKTVAFNREYAIAWLVSVAVIIVAGLAGSIPVLGWILIPFVGFYASVVAANLWATGFTQALDSTGRQSPVREEEPVV